MAKPKKGSSRASQALIQGFLQQHPQEAAKLIDSLPPEDAIRYLRDESGPTAAGVLLCLNADLSTELLMRMEDDLFRQLFTAIDPGRGVALLARLSGDSVEEKLALLPEPLAKEYRELLAYPQDTAGHLMDPRVTSFQID